MSGIRVRAIYERVPNPTIARVKYATIWLPRNAKTTSPAKNRNTEIRRRRQRLDEPEDAESTRASGKVLVCTGMVKGCVFALNYLEVSTGPLLQKCGHERARETEHETEEPDCVDEYHRRGRGERTFDRRVRGLNSTVGMGVGKLLGYLCEKRLGGNVGILLQVRIAEGNESSHRGREEASLESKRERASQKTTIIVVDAEQKRTKTRMPSAPPFQFSTFFSSSIFCTRVIYIEKMAPEGSLWVVSFGGVVSSPGYSD